MMILSDRRSATSRLFFDSSDWRSDVFPPPFWQPMMAERWPYKPKLLVN